MSGPLDEEIKKLICDNRDAWLEISGVEGVGQGLRDGLPCLKFFLSKPVDDIPAEVQGIPVETLIVGAIDKQDS